MKYSYYAVFEYSSDDELRKGYSPVGVYFPDFLGCVSVGENTNDALEMANEALSLHVDGFLRKEKPLSKPSKKEDLEKNLAPNEKLFEITIDV